MEITSLLALPHSNLASLQLELLAVPQVLLALQGFPFSTLRVKPNLSKEHTKTSVTWPSHPPLSMSSVACHPSCPYRFLHTLLLFFTSTEPAPGPGCTLRHPFAYAIPFAGILGVGIHRWYTELAFINHYVSDTSYEFISTNTLYVLFRFIFTAILGGWYIKILIYGWRNGDTEKWRSFIMIPALVSTEARGESRHCAVCLCQSWVREMNRCVTLLF